MKDQHPYVSWYKWLAFVPLLTYLGTDLWLRTQVDKWNQWAAVQMLVPSYAASFLIGCVGLAVLIFHWETKERWPLFIYMLIAYSLIISLFII